MIRHFAFFFFFLKFKNGEKQKLKSNKCEYTCEIEISLHFITLGTKFESCENKNKFNETEMRFTQK